MQTSSPSIDRRRLLAGSVLAFASVAGLAPVRAATDPYANSPFRKLTDAEWKKRLSPEAFDILRRDGTERPGSSPLLKEHRKGTFLCAGCALPLFKSKWKYESGTGWPSFYRAIPGAVAKKTDVAIGIPRTEYHCAQCLGHQGHLFNDGPQPTGLRYCNDGDGLRFAPA